MKCFLHRLLRFHSLSQFQIINTIIKGYENVLLLNMERQTLNFISNPFTACRVKLKFTTSSFNR